MLAGLLLCPFGIWLPLGQGEPSARVRAKHKTSVPALIFAPPVTSRPAPPKHNMRRKTRFHQAQSMREKSCSARKHLTQLSLWAWIAAGTKGAGLEPAKKGLRDRNSPMCTLSQNGYGANFPAKITYENAISTSGGWSWTCCHRKTENLKLCSKCIMTLAMLWWTLATIQDHRS